MRSNRQCRNEFELQQRLMLPCPRRVQSSCNICTPALCTQEGAATPPVWRGARIWHCYCLSQKPNRKQDSKPISQLQRKAQLTANFFTCPLTTHFKCEFESELHSAQPSAFSFPKRRKGPHVILKPHELFVSEREYACITH